MLQFRGTANLTRRHGVIIDMPCGLGHGDRSIARFRPDRDITVTKGVARRIRADLRVVWDGDWARTVITIDGEEVWLIPLPPK
jgi:hypothetical protein